MAVQFSTKEDTRTSEYRFRPEDLVVHGELNGRHELPDITWLIESIRDRGQQTPVVIRSDGGAPTLVFGYSRWRAIISLNKQLVKSGLPPLTIRCAYSRVNEIEGFIDNIHENRVRNPNTPIDDAHNIAKLEKWGQSIEQIMAIYHESRRWVRERRELITLEPEAQEAVRSGKIKVTAAKAIAKLSSEQQRAIVKSGKVAVRAIKTTAALPEKATIKSVREVAQTAADDTTLNKATREWIANILLPALGVAKAARA